MRSGRILLLRCQHYSRALALRFRVQASACGSDGYQVGSTRALASRLHMATESEGSKLMGDETVAGTVRALAAHIAINVRSVKESTEFYRKMLGSDAVKTRKGYAKFNIHNPPLNLTLNEEPFDGKGALSHLGIQVASTEDVVRVRQHWRAEGLITRDEMQTDCCYAVQNKSWVTDPDGNEWEVFVVLEDNLPEKIASEQPACCNIPSAPVTISR
jgi:catechol 2,3-dioxygenase-like lactoylglutathione lyase family enzyme